MSYDLWEKRLGVRTYAEKSSTLIRPWTPLPRPPAPLASWNLLDPMCKSTAKVVKDKLWIDRVGGLARYENNHYQRIGADYYVYLATLGSSLPFGLRKPTYCRATLTLQSN
jgi:hypothetical protein